MFDCTVPNNTLSRAELSYDEGTVLNVHYGDVLIKYGSVLDVQKDDIPRIPHRCREDFNGALLQDGDVIIADTAEDETTGKACEIGNLQGSAIVSGLHTMVCRPRNRMALGYLGYYLNSNAYHHQLLPLMQGIKVLSLSRSNIQKTSVSYPIAVKEQQLIAYYFSQLDNLITLHQRQPFLQSPPDISLIVQLTPPFYTFSWEQRKFEEIAVRSSVICSDDTLPRVEYEDIVSGTGRLNKDIYAKQSSKSGIVFHQGDVLYGKLRPYLQNWLLPTFDGLAVGDFWVLQPQNADSSFLYRLIQSRQFDEVANQSTGTKMPRADWKLVSKTVFSIPSNISEQAAIGTYFTALDSLITLHQRQPFLHSTPEISLTVQLIHPFYTSSWEQRKFSDVVATRRGLTYKPSDIRKNGVRVLRSSNIAEDSFVLSDEDVFVVREAVNIDCVRANDILITAANGSSRLVGKHTIISGIPEESAVHGGFMLLGTTKEPHFVNASMGSSWYRRFIELFVAGGNGAIGNLNKNDLDNQDIAIPSEKEQKKIGSFFRQLDNLITLHQRKGKAAVTGCSNDANNSKGVYCKARDFGYKCCKKVESP